MANILYMISLIMNPAAGYSAVLNRDMHYSTEANRYE